MATTNAVILIPTYNEKNNIRGLIEEIFKIVPQINIIVIDDNSPDGSGALSEQLSREYRQLKVMHRQKKEGLGRAYLAGFKEALKINPDYILQMDADHSHNPEYIPLLLKEMDNYDIAVGSRFLAFPGCPPQVSVFSLWANRYVRWILGLKLTDCTGGFKCFSRRVIEEMPLGNFISRGFVFQVEFIYRAVKKGFSVREIPIAFRPRHSGKSKKSKDLILEALFKIPLLKLNPA